MSFRLVGAVLALLAAVLLAASIATSAWWAGHPEVDGRAIKNKTVYIGLFGGEGCNTGGNGKCEPLEVASEFTLVGYIELGAAGLLIILVLVLALTTLSSSERRKIIGKAVIFSALFCAAAAAAVIVIGPNIKSTHAVAVPMGYGMYLFWGAVGAAIFGSFAAMQPRKPPVLPAPAPVPLPPPSVAPQIDVLAFFQPDPVAVSGAPVSPGGALPGPPPLGIGSPPTQSSPPLFNARAIAGMPAPPTERANTLADALENLPPPKPSQTLPPPGLPGMPPPGPRAKNASGAPPAIPSVPPLGKATPPKAPPAIATPVVPPPMPVVPMPDLANKLPMRADTDPSDHMETIDRDSMTMQREAADLIVGRPATDKGKVTEKGTAVAVGDSTDAQIQLPAEENTDVNATLERPLTDSDHRETMARDKVEPDIAPPPKPSQPKINTPAGGAAVVRDSASEIQTIARERLSASELETNELPPSAARRDKTPIPVATQPGVIAGETTPAPVAVARTTTPAPVATQPGVVARAKTPAPAVERKSEPIIPVSTASESLPPPKEKAASTAGPTPACPQCESPMGWVEEHLRFYCKSCRMYF